MDIGKIWEARAAAAAAASTAVTEWQLRGHSSVRKHTTTGK